MNRMVSLDKMDELHEQGMKCDELEAKLDKEAELDEYGEMHAQAER